MNDWKYFFDCELNNPEQFNYRIFASDSKVEILYWFSRNDIPKQQKEDFIRALVNFDDNCGGFYQYRAYFLAAEALNYFPESSFGDAIVKQLLDWSYLYFGWKLFPKPLVEAARNTLEVTDKTRVIKAFEWLLQIITALKAYLSKKFYQNCSYRYDEVYQLMWNYAENMSYQDFYKAWNN